MKRAIVKAPEDTAFDALTAGQQAALASVFAQFVLPMPGTHAHGGHIVIDAVLKDSFDPAAIGPLGLPFEVLGLWQWDGAGELIGLQALDPSFINYLPDTVIRDEGGAIISTAPPSLHEPHKLAGWPDCF